MISKIIYYLPLFVAPLIIIMFTCISAYVFRFKVPNSGIAFDYVIFTILIAIGLWLGGAI